MAGVWQFELGSFDPARYLGDADAESSNKILIDSDRIGHPQLLISSKRRVPYLLLPNAAAAVGTTFAEDSILSYRPLQLPAYCSA